VSPGPPAADPDWALLTARDALPFAGFETLYRRHRDYVFRLAVALLGSRALAEDATQEVFLRMARGRRRWRPRARFRTWLYKVTLNTCRELSRRSRREAPPSPAVEPTVDPASCWLGTDLRRAWGRLPARQREVLVLRYFEELSTAETAAVMGCRQGTVKAHLHRALTALRGELAEPDRAAAELPAVHPSDPTRALRRDPETRGEPS
jgi:RNA polymerase sigma-70 factor (ECF subfamily)